MAGTSYRYSLKRTRLQIKRLFVREPYRKLGLGKLLTRVIIQQAKKLSSYERVKLDTLERLPHCIPMYTSMGFKACPPYVPNPLGDAVYLELPLPIKPPMGESSTPTNAPKPLTLSPDRYRFSSASGFQS